MKLSFELTEDAKFDVGEAILWYYNQNNDVSDEFKFYLSEGINRIFLNPSLFQFKYSDVRVHFIEKFPYGIHYKVNESILQIIGVFHTKRSPKNWDR